MASLLVPGSSLNFQPLVPFSGRRRSSRDRIRVLSTSGSLQSAVVSRNGMAMMASIASFGGWSFSFTHATKLRLSSSSSHCFLRCNAKSVQDKQSGIPSAGVESDEKETAIVVAGSEESYKPGLQRLGEEFRRRRKNFLDDFKERHAVYKQDREQWGLGFSPIFTVHQDVDGNRFRVDVDENEIFLRSGVDPNFMQFADEECKAVAERRIEQANGHARDIQLGLVTPSPASVVYQYKDEGASSTSYVGVGSWPGRLAVGPSVANGQFTSFLIVLLGMAFTGMGIRWFVSRKKEEEDPVAHERNLRLMQMRKLKAHMSRESSEGTTDSDRPAPRENGDNGVVNGTIMVGEEENDMPKEIFGEIVEDAQPRVNDEEFQRKITEIRAMARKARLQERESLEARSAQSFERKKVLEQEMKERLRAQGLANLAKDLDDVRRFGSESSNSLEFISNDVNLSEDRKVPKLAENGRPSSSQEVNLSSDVSLSKELGADSPLRPDILSMKSKLNSPAQKATGVKPRIILSAEEARARIAAKRARSNASSSPSSSSKLQPRRSQVGSSQSNNDSSNVQPSAVKPHSSTNPIELRGSANAASFSAQETPERAPDLAGAAAEKGSPPAGNFAYSQPQANNPGPTKKTNNVVSGQDESSTDYDNPDSEIKQRTRDRAAGDGGGRGQRKSKEEEEEMQWMRDDVLREIVFKVQANEEEGREPFHNLKSEEETLFFKGLERKFDREGDKVKKWIKDRVENIDYGSDGISVYDPPESYEMKWKAGVDRSPKSIHDRFSADRERIMNEKKGMTYASPPADSEETSATDSHEESPALSSSASSASSSIAPLSVFSPSPPLPKTVKPMQQRSRETFSGDKKTKSVISSTPRPGESTTPKRSSPASAGKGNWDHTKRWAKDLERKYAMETDPAIKAIMREVGQDLERWITEDEIEAASRMLDRGVEGEEEYAKMHYERIKDKIKKQQETFGRDAMVNKYSEYKEEAEDIELWWLSLPYVVCIGLRATVEGELQTGLYSVDVAGALEGVPSLPSVAYHTVAFQDRGDAQNFCTLVNSQPEKLGAEGAQLVPFSPKDLYKDAKSEGFKVTVIKKGQLQLSVDKPLEEVENRIIELGSARYFEELLTDRVIDMDAVVDEGLGFGRQP